MSLRTLARLGAVPLALGAVVLGVAAPASAHVTITASTTAAGAFTVLTVSVPHGCEGSATTEVTIQIPEEINAVTPTRNALWEVEKEVEQLDPPVTDAHGNEITERVATVTYTADTPLPDGYRDAFELSLQLPDDEGTTLVFPTIQTCEEGESAWIEVPADGQSEDDLELPAPSVTITAAEGDDARLGASRAEAPGERQRPGCVGSGRRCPGRARRRVRGRAGAPALVSDRAVGVASCSARIAVGRGVLRPRDRGAGVGARRAGRHRPRRGGGARAGAGRRHVHLQRAGRGVPDGVAGLRRRG